jgi:hypothetical protein
MGRNRTNTIAILSRKEKIQYNWEAVNKYQINSKEKKILKNIKSKKDFKYLSI